MSAVKRIVQILDLLSQRGQMGVRAISQQLDVPVSSTHRLLLELAGERVIERLQDGEWDMSYRMLAITSNQLERMELPILAQPFCTAISEKTNESTKVNGLMGLATVCLLRVSGNKGVQVDFKVGARSPLYCGGTGKAILAYISPTEQNRVLSDPMPALTEYTFTDPRELSQEIMRIRARGYSIDNQEVIIGVYCVAVPILNGAGHAVGAMSITGTSPKQPGPKIHPWVDLLNDACGQISRRLGYGGAWPPLHNPSEEPIHIDRQPLMQGRTARPL